MCFHINLTTSVLRYGRRPQSRWYLALVSHGSSMTRWSKVEKSGFLLSPKCLHSISYSSSSRPKAERTSSDTPSTCRETTRGPVQHFERTTCTRGLKMLQRNLLITRWVTTQQKISFISLKSGRCCRHKLISLILKSIRLTGLSALVQIIWMSLCCTLLFSSKRGIRVAFQISARHSLTFFSHSVNTETAD